MVGGDGLRLDNAGCWFNVFVKVYSEMCTVYVLGAWGMVSCVC